MRTMSVTRHRPGITTNRYGQEEPTGTYTDTTQSALWVGRTSSREMTDNRQTLLDTARMALPPGTDIRETDEYTALGARWRVRGLIRFRRPTNPDEEWGVTVDLERAE